MKHTTIFTALAFVLCMNFQTVHSQDKVLEGTITTFDCILVIGAKVEVKSTGEQVKTDSLGQFKVNVSETDKLTILANGFKTKKVKIKEDTESVSIDIKLKQGEDVADQAMDNINLKDQEKFLSLVQLSTQQIDFSTYNTVYDILAGRFSNVEVAGNGDIIIRGMSSMDGNNAALIVIDGVKTDSNALRNLDTASIKSIDVLKGPSAARYGSQGANGVVEIETLRGDD